MYQFPIGVMLESFCLPDDAALDKAAQIGAKGIQMYATSGEHAPENLNAAQRRELLAKLKDRGMVFSAICGDLGMGFGDVDKNPALIERSRRILELAKDLECNIVTTHIGVVPVDPAHPRYQVLQDACGALSRYADELDAHFAVETGPETSAVLEPFLRSLGSRGLAVNLDPANLVMVTGDDPVQAVYRLKDFIVHTHAKDGVKLRDCPPEIIYSPGNVEDVIREGAIFREEPLGKGDVPFPAYLKALEEIGYRGFLTIERETGADPAADIAQAAAYLRDILKDR